MDSLGKILYILTVPLANRCMEKRLVSEKHESNQARRRWSFPGLSE